MVATGKKRKRKFHREAENLKRFRADIESYASKGAPSSVHDAASDFHCQGDDREPPKLSRKQQRKQARKLQKMRKDAFCQRLPLPTAESVQKARMERAREQQKRRAKRMKRKEKLERLREEKEKVKEKEEERKQVESEANREDDRMIKQMEKQLRLNKRKSKKMPIGFINDGLDFILNAIDSEKLKSGDLDDEDDEFMPGPGYSDEDDQSEQSAQSDEEEEEEEEVEEESMHDDSGDERGDRHAAVNLRDASDVKSILKGKSDEGKVKNVRFSASDGADDNNMDDANSSGDEDDDDDDVENTVSKEIGPDDSDDYEVGEAGEQDDDFNSGSSDENDQGGGTERKAEAPALREDIYGRVRDMTGNDVTAAYVPPARRSLATGDGKESINLERMKRRLKGLINRLSEATLPSISSQIEAMFRASSRANLSAALTAAIFDACVSRVLIPERLVSEHALCVAVLHRNVGSEVGAVCLQSIAEKFQFLYQPADSADDSKQLDNLLVLLCQLYNFKVVHSLLVFDVMKRLIERFDEKDVELLLVILRNVGFGLRKDDPVSLKEVIVSIQTKASAAGKSLSEDKSRVAFMMEVLLAIRNNNMRKIPNYDPTHVEHLKKLLRSIQRESGDNQLRVSLDDLLNSQHKGRWWIVGSAWTGDKAEAEGDGKPAVPVESQYGAEILELARLQRMNTEVRRNIFCILMTSEDFADAFEKLLRLGLKHQQEREIIHVTLDVCLQESNFNPYYAYLAQKFCECDRRFKMTVQFNIWDKFKELSEFSAPKLRNLAAFLAHLISHQALSLSVFKVLQWSSLDSATSRLVRRTLVHLLTDQPESAISTSFARVASIAKLRPLCDALRFCLAQLREKKPKGVDVRLLERHIEVAKMALVAAKMSM